MCRKTAKANVQSTDRQLNCAETGIRKVFSCASLSVHQLSPGKVSPGKMSIIFRQTAGQSSGINGNIRKTVFKETKQTKTTSCYYFDDDDYLIAWVFARFVHKAVVKKKKGWGGAAPPSYHSLVLWSHSMTSLTWRGPPEPHSLRALQHKTTNNNTWICTSFNSWQKKSVKLWKKYLHKYKWKCCLWLFFRLLCSCTGIVKMLSLASCQRRIYLTHTVTLPVGKTFKNNEDNKMTHRCVCRRRGAAPQCLSSPGTCVATFVWRELFVTMPNWFRFVHSDNMNPRNSFTIK